MIPLQNHAARVFWSRFLVSAVVGLLYVAACATPAVDYKAPATRDFGDITPYGEYYGILALLLGVMGNPIVWSANILLGVGWFLLVLKQNRIAVGLGAAAVALGLYWALTDEQMLPLVGGWLWVASFSAFTLGAIGIALLEATHFRQADPHGSQAETPPISDR
jgi:hypothetical protein